MGQFKKKIQSRMSSLIKVKLDTYTIFIQFNSVHTSRRDYEFF